MGANPRRGQNNDGKTTPTNCDEGGVNIRSGGSGGSNDCQPKDGSGEGGVGLRRNNGKRRKRQIRDDIGIIGGGFALKRAWLYDGYYWTEVADMSTIRDRPACSVLPLHDGQVSEFN